MELEILWYFLDNPLPSVIWLHQFLQVLFHCVFIEGEIEINTYIMQYMKPDSFSTNIASPRYENVLN